MNNFAIRTVRNSQVKIRGCVFAPETPAPQLEGKRMAFGLYHVGGKFENFVSLWGTQELYRSVKDDVAYTAEWEKYVELCTKDGYFIWEWWRVK
jgi:hypothetical protein